VDNNISNNSASVQTSIATLDVSSDLSIQKMPDKSILSSGDVVCYTLSALNHGPDNVSDAHVIENFSPSLIYIDHTSSQGNYSPYSKIWRIGTLDKNQLQTLTICARLISGALNEKIINSAQIFSSTIDDPYLDNNISEALITRSGLVFRPDNETTTTSGSLVIYEHEIIVGIGNQTGSLSFDTTTSQNLTWSIYYDLNNNEELDSADLLLTKPMTISSMRSKIFLRTYMDDNTPAGWQDSTIVKANLIVQEQTLRQYITNITHVIDQRGGEMHAQKEVALDTNCNASLSDETHENQLFETSKVIAPGECAIYRIHYMNQGIGKLSKIEIEDYIPQFSKYMAGSAIVLSIPTGLTSGDILTPDNNGTGLIKWNFSGNLFPGKSGTVSYEVKIDANK
jgi:uncharacterized repeat protein (TIGR01451 family)